MTRRLKSSNNQVKTRYNLVKSNKYVFRPISLKQYDAIPMNIKTPPFR